jgi:hypothetical protein
LHGYTKLYNAFLEQERLRFRSLLEIGVGNEAVMGPILKSAGRMYRPGASLRMWADYFPDAAIIGCDIDRTVLFNEGRIKTYYADQSNADDLRRLICSSGQEQFDMILDDGSHEPAHFLVSLEILWPHVRQGGYYIIEDIRRMHMPNVVDSEIVRSVRNNAFYYARHSEHDWDSILIFKKI